MSIHSQYAYRIKRKVKHLFFVGARWGLKDTFFPYPQYIWELYVKHLPLKIKQISLGTFCY